MLVYADSFERIDEAREAEARIKKWRRAWKIALIEKTNPDWRDLYDEIVQPSFPGRGAACNGAPQIRGPSGS